MDFSISVLSDISDLSNFNCGIGVMDNFIHQQMQDSHRNHYCTIYIVKDLNNKNVIALFGLNFDSLDLDEDDKEEIMTGKSQAKKPLIDCDYKETFMGKKHYPALEISYLAVDKKYQKQGIGEYIVEQIVWKAQAQSFAGCQFITVEALKLKDYSAVAFYDKCHFSSCEYPKPNKDTLRMFRTLFPKVDGE